MIPIKKFLIVYGILVFVLSACNLNAQAPTSNPLGEAATIVAKTLQAQGSPTPKGTTVAATPFASPVAPTATKKPSLVINKDDSKCRSGPGPDFKVIASYNTGTTVDLVGKDSADSYWLVKDPTSLDICFIQAGDSTPGGSYENLPEVTPQPVVNNNVPARPGSITA